MDTKGNTTLCCLVLLLVCFVVQTDGGECCRAVSHIFSLLATDDKWCDAYCCMYKDGPLHRLDCCQQAHLRAPAPYRQDFCGNWFLHHLWVPIVVGVILLLLFVVCGVCCCCWIC